MKIDQIILIIDEVGYPVLMAIGMGYFIWYVWKYVTKELKPKISASHKTLIKLLDQIRICLLYTSPSPRDGLLSRMPSSA